MIEVLIAPLPLLPVVESCLGVDASWPVAVVGNDPDPEEAVKRPAVPGVESEAILPINHAGTHPRLPVSCWILHPDRQPSQVTST